jgi:tRNA G18 (ribose-2'-O)-methylase SpoU
LFFYSLVPFFGEKRRDSIQRAWISSSLIKIEPKIKKLLSYLAKQKKPYRLVEDNKELCAVSGSVHHEGIVLQTDPFQPLTTNEGLSFFVSCIVLSTTFSEFNAI